MAQLAFNDTTEFAVRIASGLSLLTEAPIGRFFFLLTDPRNASGYMQCQSSYYDSSTCLGLFQARFVSPANVTYTCTPVGPMPRVLQLANALPGGFVSLEQLKVQASAAARAEPTRLQWQVGIYPPTRFDGDFMPASQVAWKIVSAAQSSPDPTRELQPNGTWKVEVSDAVKFAALFPNERATARGQDFPRQRSFSIPLGPNPGGVGAPLPGDILEAQRKQNASQAIADKISEAASQLHAGYELGETELEKVEEENKSVREYVQELQASLARASKAHFEALVTNPFNLSEATGGLVEGLPETDTQLTPA